jgi:phage-related minor tail protein
MKYGSISAGQYAQAMKYLPMQMTDVVTSLASGMPLWMVAIQQGGQIKDSFGGAG